MPTPNQLLKKMRSKKKHKSRSPLLKGNPQKRGMCVRVLWHEAKEAKQC